MVLGRRWCRGSGSVGCSMAAAGGGSGGATGVVVEAQRGLA